MRIAFYTDMHWSGVGPKRRKDRMSITDTIEAKHRFIYEDAQEKGAECFLFGGDMNETHTIAYSLINRQMELMRTKRKVPEYGIIGNHDVVGNNSERVNQVSVSTLYSSGLMNRLGPEPTRIVGEDGTVLAVFGVDIHKDMDNLRPEDYYIEKPEWADFAILVAHGWLREKEIAIEGVRHTTYKDVMATGTQADLILTGHDHKGHQWRECERKDGGITIFLNPGSPMRLKAAEYEMERRVGYALIYFNEECRLDGSFESIPKSIARPSEYVLDRESLLEDIERKEAQEAVQRKFETFSISSSDPRGVILEVAKENNISEPAKADLVARIEDASLKLSERDLKHSV